MAWQYPGNMGAQTISACEGPVRLFILILLCADNKASARVWNYYEFQQDFTPTTSVLASRPPARLIGG